MSEKKTCNSSRSRRLLVLAGLACTTLLGGCGTGLPETIPVTGTVTFDGGPCPAKGELTFLLIEAPAGGANRPGMARFDKEGNYSAKSFSGAEGLLPGKYQVRVQCTQGQANEVTGAAVKNHVPQDFLEELVVPADASGPITANFDISTK